MNPLKSMIFFSGLLILMSSFQLYSQPETIFNGKPAKFPAYQEIVEYFFIHYNPEDYKSANFHQFRFARKPDGWDLFIEEWEKDSIIISHHFHLWDFKKGYSRTDTAISKLREINSPGLMPEILSNIKRYNFIIHPYYGYKGWEKDVIKAYRKKNPKTLSNYEIYGIARAYGSLASNIIWSHGEFSDPEKTRDINASGNHLKKFLFLTKKSLEYYSFLHPSFYTRTGPAATKQSIEVMARWYETTLFKPDISADVFLEKVNYPQESCFDPFWLKSSQIILKNLEKNAILFTLGDLDTYPHLFNQAYNNIRKDILIINLSLLNDPVYFNHISKGFLDAKAISTGLTKSEYAKLPSKDFIIRNTESKPDIKFPDLLSDITFYLNEDINPVPIEFGYMSIPLLDENHQPDSLRMLNATHRQLLLNQLFVQDILYHNLQNRPVYFTRQMSPQISGMFNPETMLDEGFVVHLTNSATKNQILGDTYYNESIYENILKEWNIRVPDKNNYSFSRFYGIYLEMESRWLIGKYMGAAPDSGIDKILTYLEKYPPQQSGVSISYLNMIISLYNTGVKNELADMFLKAFLVEMEFQIRAINLSDSNPYDLEQLRFLNFIIDSLLNSSLNPSIPGFYENLQSYRRSVQNKLRQMPELIIQ